jgi:hypothetical protein
VHEKLDNLHKFYSINLIISSNSKGEGAVIRVYISRLKLHDVY